MKLKLCWFCRTKLNSHGQDNALLWDVRLCCKKCYLEQLIQWNAKLENSRLQASNKLPEASGDTK
jgi:hypothetical protein